MEDFQKLHVSQVGVSLKLKHGLGRCIFFPPSLPRVALSSISASLNAKTGMD